MCVCVYVQLSLGGQPLLLDNLTPEEEAAFSELETEEQMFSVIIKETSDFCADWGKDNPVVGNRSDAINGDLEDMCLYASNKVRAIGILSQEESEGIDTYVETANNDQSKMLVSKMLKVENQLYELYMQTGGYTCREKALADQRDAYLKKSEDLEIKYKQFKMVAANMVAFQWLCRFQERYANRLSDANYNELQGSTARLDKEYVERACRLAKWLLAREEIYNLIKWRRFAVMRRKQGLTNDAIKVNCGMDIMIVDGHTTQGTIERFLHMAYRRCYNLLGKCMTCKKVQTQAMVRCGACANTFCRVCAGVLQCRHLHTGVPSSGSFFLSLTLSLFFFPHLCLNFV
jgi:hypothetical protein